MVEILKVVDECCRDLSVVDIGESSLRASGEAEELLLGVAAAALLEGPEEEATRRQDAVAPQLRQRDERQRCCRRA